MLNEFQSMCDGYIWSMNVPKHRIDLLNDKKRPVHSTPYRAGPTAEQLTAAEASRMLAENVMEPLTAEWEARIVLATKKDCSFGIHVDYRKLNADTLHEAYAFPSMDSFADSIRGAIMIFTLNAGYWYWKIEIDERDRNKVAFTSHRRLYSFTSMSFGLMNTPETFQRAADVILRSVG